MASNILKSVTVSGQGQQPGIRAVIAGQEKMGKTTMLASTPKPLFVPLEEGTAAVMVPKTPKILSWENLNDLVDEIIANRGAGFQTIAFDGAVGIERLVHEYTVRLDPQTKNNKASTMETAHGGYGKAYAVARNHFQDFLDKLDILSRNGINIVMASHVFATKMTDPTAGEFDSWDLLLHSPKNNKTYGIRETLTQWADMVGFLYEPFLVSKSNNVTMGISSGKGRVMGVSRMPQYTAGNRFHMTGEFAIGREQSWNYIAHEIKQACGLNYMA